MVYQLTSFNLVFNVGNELVASMTLMFPSGYNFGSISSSLIVLIIFILIGIAGKIRDVFFLLCPVFPHSTILSPFSFWLLVSAPLHRFSEIVIFIFLHPFGSTLSFLVSIVCSGSERGSAATLQINQLDK